MGSGPSKEQNSAPKRQAKPVANVNNPNTAQQNQVQIKPQNAFITQPDDNNTERGGVAGREADDNRNNSLNRNQALRDENEGIFSRQQQHGGTGRQQQQQQAEPQTRSWRADLDTQNELNEMLQMPTGGRPVNTVNPISRQQQQQQQQDLPETYAERKRREQYTHNQQTLIRQKTIYRDPDTWKEEEDMNTGGGGFDPNKFRSVNFGQSTKTNLFTTKTNQDGPQYMPGQQNMDEFDFPHQACHEMNTNRSVELPTYNASEQDLMASLERDLM